MHRMGFICKARLSSMRIQLEITGIFSEFFGPVFRHPDQRLTPVESEKVLCDNDYYNNRHYISYCLILLVNYFVINIVR